MSDHTQTPSKTTAWLETWWPLLLILLGIIFTTCLIAFKPTT